MQLKALILASLVAVVTSNPFINTSRAASAISAFYKTNRFKAAFLTCSIKGCSADLVAQYIAASKEQRDEESKDVKNDNALSKLNPLKKTRGGDLAVVEEKKKFSIDKRRSLMFFLYGGFYQGCVGEFIYNNILPILGTGTDIKTVAKKVVLDMGFISPLICIPSEYSN